MYLRHQHCGNHNKIYAVRNPDTFQFAPHCKTLTKLLGSRRN